MREPGFFQFLYNALHQDGATVDESVPFSREGTTDRHHDGAWVRMGNALVFFDMSDHVFDFDLNGLRHADLYFKTNLNRRIADRVLERESLSETAHKLRAFTFLPPSLPKCRKIASLPLQPFLPKAPFFHVVGVYENPVRDGFPDPFAEVGQFVEPHVMHFWIRWHFAKVLRQVEPKALSRLTSRGNREIEDGENVSANLNHQMYLFRMAGARCTVLNTFPHAVYPWKALESLALGTPFVMEREPLIEIPKPFRPVKDLHFLEVLPGFGNFDEAAPLSEPASYRILEVPDPNEIEAGLIRVAEMLGDADRLSAMREGCRSFAKERLSAQFITGWLYEEVRAAS